MNTQIGYRPEWHVQTSWVEDGTHWSTKTVRIAATEEAVGQVLAARHATAAHKLKPEYRASMKTTAQPVLVGYDGHPADEASTVVSVKDDYSRYERTHTHKKKAE